MMSGSSGPLTPFGSASELGDDLEHEEARKGTPWHTSSLVLGFATLFNGLPW